MTPEQLQQGKEWARRWKEAGPLLERIRQEELLEMTPERRRAASLAVLDMGAPFDCHRTTSGLVEQQRIFMRARR